MFRFIIEIEEVPDDPNHGVNLSVRSEKERLTGIEEALADRINPILRALPSTLKEPPAGE